MSISRKKDRFMRRRTVILAVLGCLLAWAGVTAGSNSFAVLSFMSELDRVESSSLWPGFNPDVVPAAVFDGSKTYLFDHPRPPDAFRPLEGAGRVSVYEGQYGGFKNNEKLRIGETWVATCLARPSRGAGDLDHGLHRPQILGLRSKGLFLKRPSQPGSDPKEPKRNYSKNCFSIHLFSF
jgi:hypothetical protein